MGIRWRKRKQEEYETAFSNVNEQLQSMRRELVKMEVLYKGFGGILTRIRQALKAIKTDDAQAQSKIKDLSSSILQNALPERKTPTMAETEEEDERLVARLQAATGNELNPSDKKLAIYLSRGLTTQEISVVTGLLPKSVNQSRYRLRRALGLEQDDNLEDTLLHHLNGLNSHIETPKTDIDNKESEISDS